MLYSLCGWLDNGEILIENRVATLKYLTCYKDEIMIYLMDKGIDTRIAFKIMDTMYKGKVKKYMLLLF